MLRRILRLSGLQESLEPEGVIDVTMGEDRGVDRGRRLLPQQGGERGRERRHSGIDQHDARDVASARSSELISN